MMLIDAQRGIDGDAQIVLDGLGKHARPAIAVLSKIDLIDKRDLLPLAARLDQTGLFQAVMMISCSDRRRRRRSEALSRRRHAGGAVAFS